MPKSSSMFPETLVQLAAKLRSYRKRRRARVFSGKPKSIRRALSKADRTEILAKTRGRCHLCGGVIGSAPWDANHVFPLALGGKQGLENYLPTHRSCNGAKWHLRPKELALVLKLGAWLRSEIERGTSLGKTAGEAYCKTERRRAGRRKRVG
jgi:5-methylcytosine-specific restriction endonuclease McrA